MEILNFVNEEIIKDVDLPGLTVEDIEAVLSENADWSGEQIEQFLRSESISYRVYPIFHKKAKKNAFFMIMRGGIGAN